MSLTIQIKRDDLRGPEIAGLLREHLADMHLHTPPESVHALDLENLQQANVTFWSAWQHDELLGCGALKALDAHHAEIKSMRTARAHLRKGVARQILEHLLGEASRMGFRRLSLETGSMAAFEPARRLYLEYGFTYCMPFGEYIEDPNNVFMTREL